MHVELFILGIEHLILLKEQFFARKTTNFDVEQFILCIDQFIAHVEQLIKCEEQSTSYIELFIMCIEHFILD